MRRAVIILFFIILTFLAFRQYVFGGLVPIQFNLMPSFYSPWRFEKWPGYERGVPNKPIGTDNPKLFYPYRKFTTEEFKQRRVPLWNPYVFSGNIHAATYQAAVWYPFNFLYFLLPQADAWSMFILLQPILVGWFTFLFMRSQGISARGSLFGSIAFAFSGWMIAWWEESIVIVHSILWLPLALYAVARRRWLLLVFALSMSILAGFLQMSIYLFATVIVWSIYCQYCHPRPDRGSSLSQRWIPAFVGMTFIITAILLVLLITAIQWAPALEAYFLSPRGTVAATFLFDQYLVPLRHLITLVVPDFWGNPGSYNYFFPRLFYHEKVVWIGLFPLLFAVYGFRMRFWGIFTIIVLSLGFALPTSWIWYILRVPVLSAAQPARIFVLFAFGASVLSAYGMDAWLSGRIPKKRIALILLVLLVVLTVLWSFVLFAKWKLAQDSTLSLKDIELYGRYATISLRNLFIPTFSFFMAFVVLFFIKNKKLAFGFIILVTIAWSLYAADKFLYFSDRRFEFPETAPITKLKELTSNNYARVWGYGDAAFTPNMLSYYGLYSPEGYDALFSREYGELLHTIKSGGVVSDQIDRTDAILKGMTERDPMDQSPIRLQLMSQLGVRYILEYKNAENKDALSSDKRFPPSLFTVSWENDLWRIWEYTNARPRAWFEGEGNVLIRRYEPNVVELRVSAKTGGTVVLSDTYYPGWVARVDGIVTPIYRTDYTLRGIPVESGSHTVILTYEPLSFRLGLLGSGLGIVVIACVLWYTRMKL